MNKRILYAKAVYGDAEKKAVMQSLDNSWLAAGPLVSQFEKEISNLFVKSHGLATNSGSSANLLAVTSLGIPRGSEVITPACTFATTVAPLVQNGLVPVFVDSVIGRYTINEDLVENAITEKTKLLMIPQLIGGVSDMAKLRDLADKYGLYLIDDSCDTIAPQYGDAPIARWSDLSTTSFYGSHLITSMGSGGMVMTDNDELITRLRSLANWGRVGTDNEDFHERFDYQLDGIPYDAKFIYSNIGYNVKMTEGQAAFGLEQLKRLRGFQVMRDEYMGLLLKYFERYSNWFYLPELLPGARTTWLALPLTIKPEAPFTRYELLKWLDSHGIQVRILFSGNITKHPAYRDGVDFRVHGSLEKADEIMENGLLVGAHHGLSYDDITYMTDTFEEFLCKQP